MQEIGSLSRSFPGLIRPLHSPSLSVHISILWFLLYFSYIIYFCLLWNSSYFNIYYESSFCINIYFYLKESDNLFYISLQFFYYYFLYPHLILVSLNNNHLHLLLLCLTTSFHLH